MVDKKMVVGWLTKMVDKDGGHRWFDKDVCER